MSTSSPEPRHKHLAIFTTEELLAELRTRVKEDDLTWMMITNEQLVEELQRRNPKFDLHWTDKASLSLQQYQQNALITEAPVDEKRWESLSVPILANLERVQFLIYTTHLDNAKKFAAYGKLPKRGEFIHTENLSEFGFEYSYHDVPLDKPVYRALHAIVGIVTEVQELLEWLDTGVNGESGSYRRQTIQISAETVKLENFDVTNLKEELGDFFWYFALLADVFGFSLQECLELNEAKLQKVRYKQGKFTAEEAANRDLEAEAKVLGGDETTADEVVAMKEVLEANSLAPKPEAVRSEKNKNVWQALVELPCQYPGGMIPAGSWFFLDESGHRHGWGSSEGGAIAQLERYCSSILGHSEPVDTSADVCGYCGKTGHNITTCSEKAKLSATPTTMDQKVVAVEAKAQTGIIAGDTVRSLRRSLDGYRFIVNRIDPDFFTYCTVDRVSPDDDSDNPYTVGEEIKLTLDELVKLS